MRTCVMWVDIYLFIIGNFKVLALIVYKIVYVLRA
jgi:hypothetical protein